MGEECINRPGRYSLTCEMSRRMPSSAEKLKSPFVFQSYLHNHMILSTLHVPQHPL